MSKAILVLDEMPAGCPTCQLCHLSANYNARMCGAAKLEMAAKTGAYERRDDCPLREMPERRFEEDFDWTDLTQKENAAINYGWNKCLNKLEGNDDE